MKMRGVLFLLIVFPAFLISCQTLKESAKFQFAEGYYYSRLYHKKMKKIYVVPGEDSIKIYSAKKISKAIDTTVKIKFSFPEHIKPAAFESYTFKRNSFDIDVLNVLFKLRPSVNNFPPQFNNNILNGAFYFGKRSDLYRLKYNKTPLQVYNRTITHYSYSFGAFTGFGAARIDEYVTQNNINIQYDGLVNLWGLAAIVALDKVNFGLTLGKDFLLDKNKKLWIYQGKPWIGISIGLNLN